MQSQTIKDSQKSANVNHSKSNLPQVTLRQATIVNPELAESNYLSVIQRSTSHLSLEKQGPSDNNSDASSNRSRAGSQTSMSVHWLKEKLGDARSECPENKHSFFVPRSVQKDLITVPIVAKDILARNPSIGESLAAEYAKKTCEHAQRLYATLAYVKRGADICNLLDEGVTDKDLPLRRQPNDRSKFALHRQEIQEDKGTVLTILRPISAMLDWPDKALEKFDRVQWWMNAPVFVSGKRHIFDSETVLPFIECETQQEKEVGKGGYSKVYVRRIHHSHHDFSTDVQGKASQVRCHRRIWLTRHSVSRCLLSRSYSHQRNRNFSKKQPYSKLLGLRTTHI